MTGFVPFALQDKGLIGGLASAKRQVKDVLAGHRSGKNFQRST
jgi:hypothetical protein